LNGVTVAQTVVVSEQRHAALPAELAGSLVLAAADALASLSMRVGPQELVLLEDGTMRVCGGTPADEASAERSLRSLLDRVLLSACSVTPALLRAARRPCHGSVSDLVRELEVALIPTNRGAARRALARLCREVTQAIRSFPQLQQAAEAVQIGDSAQVITEVKPLNAPPAIAVSEPVVPEQWFDVSPEFPDLAPDTESIEVVIQTSAPGPAMEIPDLEVPVAVPQPGPLQPTHWQPVEHTQELSFSSRSTPKLRNNVAVCSQTARPVVSDSMQPTQPVEPEFIVLSDDDLHEVTAELQIETPDTLTPPSAPSAADGLGEYQTAEPFLLVLPALGHATAPTTDGACIETASRTVDVATPEPCAGESEDTVLDAVTFVDDEPLSTSGEPNHAEIDSGAVDGSASYVPSRTAERSNEPTHAPLGPHAYMAKARFGRGVGNVMDRIEKFSVARSESSDELTRGLRNLAGIEPDSAMELSKTPPPTSCNAEPLESGRPVPSGAFVKTLIGLGATGLCLVLSQATWGRPVTIPAAANAAPIAQPAHICDAILTVTDIPLGTTIHLTQAGPNPKSQFLRVDVLPFHVDGLACGEPADLLVELSNNGWFRIPIEGWQLTSSGTPRPLRVAEYLNRR
jgi:hypothetical protein